MSDNRVGMSVLGLFLSQVKEDVSIKFKRKWFSEYEDIPWMRCREINFIIDLLKNLKPKSCLEWGSGNSTKYFTRFIPEDATWLSVEHDEEWGIKVKAENKASNISIAVIPPNDEPVEGLYTSGDYFGENRDGTYEDFKDYIEFPERNKPFDFILVDGRARSQCVLKARELLTENGIVLLHDANRIYYQDAFKKFDQTMAFLDNRTKSGGMIIGSNGKRPFSEIIDVETYSRLWNFYEKFGQFIKV